MSATITKLRPGALLAVVPCVLVLAGLQGLVGSLRAEGALPVESATSSPPVGLPAGYRYIGRYQLRSKTRVENGRAMPVVIAPLVYRVYSDGIEVRVYVKSGGEESYTGYGIYRSDGIGVARRSGEIDVVAGVQAYCTKGEMIRQVSVTRDSITMVKMPPRSHRVLVTCATALNDQSGSAENK